jgi:uncharacterized protein
MVVRDAHVHLFPAGAMADPAGWAARHGETHWARLAQSPLQGWADADAIVRQMDMDGIEFALLVGWYWQTAAATEQQNACLHDAVARHPGRFAAFASVAPQCGETALAALDAALAAGFAGIGECLPQVQGFGWDDPVWLAMLHTTNQRRGRVLMHVTEPVGHLYPGKVATPLQDFVTAAGCYPDIRWVLAHWGGGLPFYHLNPAVATACANVWYDTAASPLLYSPAIWRVALSLVPPGRIMFGSDYPLRCYPRRQSQPDFRLLVDEARSQIDDPATLAAILGQNLDRLLE